MARPRSTRPRRVRQTLNPPKAAQDAANKPPTRIGDIEDLTKEPPPVQRSKHLWTSTSGSPNNGDSLRHSWTEFDIVMNHVDLINDLRHGQDKNGNSRQSSLELSSIGDLEGLWLKSPVSVISNEKESSPPVDDDAPFSKEMKSQSEKLCWLYDEAKIVYERLKHTLKLEEQGWESARSQMFETCNNTPDHPKDSPSLIFDSILKEVMYNLHTPTCRDEESEGEYWAYLVTSVRIGKDWQNANLKEKLLRPELRDEARELHRERHHTKTQKKEKKDLWSTAIL
jgi:hypothetical protein